MYEVVGKLSLLMRHVFDYAFTHGQRVAMRLQLSWKMNVPCCEMVLGAFRSNAFALFLFPCSIHSTSCQNTGEAIFLFGVLNSPVFYRKINMPPKVIFIECDHFRMIQKLRLI